MKHIIIIQTENTFADGQVKILVQLLKALKMNMLLR